MRTLAILSLLLFSLPTAAFAGPFIGETSVYAREAGRDQYFFYKSGGNGDGQIEYICVGDAGNSTGAAKWQIRKFVYDSSNRVSTITWANGTDNMNKVCDDRTSYDY